MRTFELGLWLIGFGWAAWSVVWRPTRLVTAGFAAASLVVAFLHLTVEGLRFHMVPTYALLTSLAALTASRARGKPQTARSRLWVLVAKGIPVAIWVVLAAALPLLFPVFTYEEPTGPYGIGTASYEVTDATHHRDLVIQAWYPISAYSQGTPVGITSRPELLEAAYASFTGLPKPLFDHLRLIKTHAIHNAPMAADRSRFPVVLFSHGPLSANRSQSVFQMEALASRGFVAVAIDHTGYASTTIFPDGRAVAGSPGGMAGVRRRPVDSDAEDVGGRRASRHRSAPRAE